MPPPTSATAAQTEASARTRPAGLPLVLAAALYDGLLSVALLFAASVGVVALNDGNAIPPDTLSYDLFLLAVPLPYFAWCWTHGGQTLGMRAWQLRLRRVDDAPVTFRDAFVRYVGAVLSWAAAGLGFAWMLTASRHSWHDRLSGTRVYRIK